MVFKFSLIFTSFAILAGCGSADSGAIDKLLGNFSSAPILTSVPDQIVQQGDLLSIDVDNIKESVPGNDKDMSYTCVYDTTVDGKVDSGTSCSSITNSTVSFSSSSGILLWTPQSGVLGNYEIKITGRNLEGSYDEIFTVGVRLKFLGIGLYTTITGTSVTATWTPNLAAQSYQVFKLNTTSGQYELFRTVAGGASSGTTITGLSPNTPYTLRVQALDALGNLDGNVVSRSFTTTELVQLAVTAPVSTLAAGTPTTITVQAFNANGSPQTIGGLPVVPLIASGTSSGNFSAVTDNNNGTYTFTFTPTTVGTGISIEVSINITYFLQSTVSLAIIPGPASSANSSISISSGTVVSGNAVTVTATVRDAYNNPISSGQTIAFTKSGGTSSGNYSAITNQGSGVYSISYTGITAGTAQTLGMTADGTALTPTTSIQVLPGAPVSANSTLAISSATVSSGNAVTVTATLKDINNNPVPSGIMVVFNKSGGTSTGTFSSVVNAGAGVYTTTYTGVVSGTAQTLSVTVDGVTLSPNVTVAVVPGTAHLANCSLTVTSPTVVSGNFVTVSATLKDINNNTIDSGITVTFSKTGGTSTGTFNSVTNAGNGVYNVRYTGVAAGTAQTLAVLINGSDLGLSSSVSVLTGAPSPTTSSISIASSTVTSGQAVTVTATIKDDNNNPVTGGVAITFSKTGGTSTGTFGSVTNAGNGVYTVDYTGVTAGTAQTISVLTDGSALGPSTTVSVNAAAPSGPNSSLTISSNSITSGQTATLTATLRDLNNNPISSGVTVTFTKTGGTSTGTYSSVVNQGSGVYTTTYTGIVAGSAQTLEVLANAASLSLTQNITVNVGAPSVANSSISIASGTVTSGQAVTVTATVKDSNNNPITSGVAVTFSKSGGTSTGTFGAITNQGAGVYTVDYTGIVAGTAQTLDILIDGFALGPTTTVSVLPGAPSNALSTLTISANTVIAGQAVTLTATIKDANANPISSGILVQFDKSGGTSFGNYSVVTNQGAGVYTATYTGITAGTAQTVQANVNGSGLGPTQSIQVLVGAPALANSSLTLSSGTVASGNSVNITAVIRDSQNNPITSEYAITFDTIGGSSTGTISAINNGGNGTFTATYSGIVAGSAQTLRVLSDGSPISGLTQTIQVVAGAANAANSLFSIGASTVQSSSATTLSINLRDVNNNAISSGATITFNKSAGVSDGTIGTVNNTGSGNYNATYTATTMGAAQTINLVVNGTSVGLSVNVTVTAGPPTHFAISQPTNPLASIDCNGPYILTLKDANENTTTSLSVVNLSFSSAPSGGDTGTLFSDSSCSTGISAITVPVFTSATQFYYKAYVPNSFTLTATSSVGTIANADITITNIPVMSWLGASSYFTMNGSGSGTVMDDSTGGLWSPYDVAINGDYMFAVDYSSHRILKYNITTNQFIGWIGYVGSTEGLIAADAGAGCTGLAINALTPTWCQGGRSSTSVSASTVLQNPRNIAVDSTYIYVSSYSNHRVSRFLQSDGSFQGWIGKIGGTIATSPASCVSAGTNATTPTWCYGGNSTSGTADGQFNTVTGLMVYSGKLYVLDYSNHRLMKFDATSGVFEGWVGRANVAPSAGGGQLATCATPPVSGARTPGWCLGGTSQVSARRQQSVAGPPAEVAPPDEGFYNPSGVSTDGTYLYVADGNNYRIARLNLSTGAFSGWIGYVYRTSALAPTAPAQASGTYTTTWTDGGVTGDRASNGWGFPYSVIVDTSSSPNYLYIADSYHRVTRVVASDGSDLRWIGRAGASPTGGYIGCSSTPVGGTNPGWCLNGSGNRYGNTNGTFYSPTGLAMSASKLFVSDYSNFRIQRFDRTNGTFDGWIGGGNLSASKWSRTIAGGAKASRSGIDDSSFGDMATAFAGVFMNTNHMFVADPGWHRIKKYNRQDGSFVGYIGQIQNGGGFYPVGPESCVGYTSGMTPDWCTGGGRTTSGSGIHGYNNPYAVAADGTYVYIANYSNHRIDRVRITDALYLGWIGQVSTTPTDGDPACLTTVSPNPSPNWCIGGTATSGSINGKLNAPRALFYDTADTKLYAIDNTSRIMKINTTDGSFAGVIGGVTAGTGCTVTNNTASGWCVTATGDTATSRYGGMSSASAIATNSTYIFAADTGNHRIIRFNKSTGAPDGFISKLTNATNINTTGTGGACNGVVAGYPRVTPGWCWTTTQGQTMNNTTGTEEGAFNGPRGVWADETYVYVSDTVNNRIVRINAATGVFAGWKGAISSIAGMSDADCIAAGVGGVTPKWCYGGASRAGLQLGAFDYPTGMFGDANYLYVHDGRNNRLQTIPKN